MEVFFYVCRVNPGATGLLTWHGFLNKDGACMHVPYFRPIDGGEDFGIYMGMFFY